MKSSVEILEALYQIVNISKVTDLIDGKVYLDNIPDANEKQNISLQLLNNSKEYLQQGFCKVNIHVRETSSGRANLAKIKEVSTVLLTLLEDASYSNYWFQIEEDQGVLKHTQKDSMYIYHLKLKYQTL